MDKEKILGCLKLNYSRSDCGRKRQEEVSQLTTAGQKQQQTAHIPECKLELWINFHVAISTII